MFKRLWEKLMSRLSLLIASVNSKRNRRGEAPAPPTAPFFSGNPVLTVNGVAVTSAQVGAVVGFLPGFYDGTRPITVTTRFLIDGVPVGADNALTYTLLSGDATKALTVRMQLVNAANPGAPITATSAALTATAAPPAPSPEPPPPPPPPPPEPPTSLGSGASASPTPGTYFGCGPDAGEVDTGTYAGLVRYVDSVAGNDALDGASPATAWKTIRRVNQSLGSSDFPPKLSTLPTNSAVLFKRGQTFDGFLAHNVSGIVTFGAYGTGARPVLEYVTPYSNHATIFGNYKALLRGWFGAGMRVRNLELRGNTTYLTSGISAINASSCHVYNCHIHGHRYMAVALGPTGSPRANRIVHNCLLEDNEQQGTFSEINDSTLTNNTWRNNGSDTTREHNIYLAESENVTIRFNLLERGANFGIVLHGRCDNVHIADNDLVGNRNGIDVSGGYGDSRGVEGFTNFMIERNRIRMHPYAGGGQGLAFRLRGLQNSTIRNNVVYSNAAEAMNIESGDLNDLNIKNVLVANNTFYSTISATPYVLVSGSRVEALEIRNNIFVNTGTTNAAVYALMDVRSSVPDGQITLSNNLYYAPNNSAGVIKWKGTNYSPSALFAFNGKEAGSLQANPLLVNPGAGDLKLGVGSPAYGAGVPLAGVPTDYLSVTRSLTAPTIGAYEA